jgi:hypothetical protein
MTWFFHVIGCSDLIIMVDNSRTSTIFEHCMCVMFVFQLGSLMYKDISYDYNNFVSSSLYQIPTTSLQGIVSGWLWLLSHYW